MKEDLEKYDDAQSDDERKRWALGGEEFKLVAGYIAALSDLCELSSATFAHYEKLRGVVNAYDPGKFDELPVASQVRAALAGRLIDSVDSLDKTRSSLKNASAFLDDFRATYEKLIVLAARATGHPNLVERAERLRAGMLGPQVTSSDGLLEVKEQARTLELEIAEANEQPRRIVEGAALAEVAGAAALPERLAALRSVEAELGGGGLPSIQAAIGQMETRELPLPEPRKLRRQVAIGDFWFNVASGALTVIAGMAAVYGGNAAFGSLGDYGGLMLWGIGVDTGVKLIRQFAPSFIGRLAGF